MMDGTTTTSDRIHRYLHIDYFIPVRIFTYRRGSRVLNSSNQLRTTAIRGAAKLVMVTCA